MSQVSNAPHQEIILTDESYFTSLISDINKAEKSIDLETYIFSDDEIGQEVAHVLCAAAKRKVNVRVLVDGIGSLTWNYEMIQQMETAGITVRIFHPFPFIISHWKHLAHPSSSILIKIFDLLSKVNSRNHRKTCIIDHKIVYIGSANITKGFIRQSNFTRWRDTGVKLVGIDISDLQYVFEKAFNSVSLKKRFDHVFHQMNVEPIIRLNDTFRRRRILYKLLLNKMENCKKRIWVTNAYFIPNDLLLRKLIKASKKGIDVRILLPHQSDVFIASLASRTFYSILLNHGVLIYEYLPSMMHAKTLIIDDWYSVGSSNLDNRSLKHNLEIDVDIRTNEAKQILEQQFLDDVKQSRLINFDSVQKQAFYKKILGRIILIIKYWI